MPRVADGTGRPGRDGRHRRGQPAHAKYADAVDRESAREKLAARLEAGARKAEAGSRRPPSEAKPKPRSPTTRKRPARRRTRASSTTS